MSGRDPKSEEAFADTIINALVADHGKPVNPSAVPIAKGTPDRYRIEGTIGEGGMGRVLDATDQWFGRRVAMKEILVANAPLSLTRRFLVEALVTGNLEHPGIVPVYERGVRDGRPYYVMRKLVGRTLGEALRDAKDLRARLDVLPALVRVAHTIAFAHGRGVIHRDLKPENVILGSYDEVTVIDWGIARVRDLEKLVDGDADAPALKVAKDNQTALGAVVGTPQYMSPEQAAGEIDAIDERTDVFALGALLYHVISGRAPYDGATANAVVAKALAVECPDVRSLDAKVPRAIAEICSRAMSRQKSDRFASARDMAKALDAAIANALQTEESQIMNVFLLAVSIGAVAVGFVAMIFVTTRYLHAFSDLGLAAYLTVGVGLVGIVLSMIELWTKGRYKLGSLVFVFAILTMVDGAIAFAAGMMLLLRALTEVHDDAKFRAMAVSGAFETLGNVIVGLSLGGFLLLLWAIAQRRIAREKKA